MSSKTKFLPNLLNRFIRFCRIHFRNLGEAEIITQFQKLSPFIANKCDYENKIYKEAFDFVFKNKDLRNIAISGAYGAGKSSVFESYMHHWQGRKQILRISLAHFEQLENCGEATKSQDEASLEAKIINQLVHQINPSKINKTSFIARIRDNLFCQILKSLGIFIFILITIFLVFFQKIRPVLANLTLKPLQPALIFFITSEGLLLLAAILLLILFTFILSVVLHSRGNNLLKKISVKDITLDLPDETTESFFDKYLTEIRYLFDKSGSTIVAIEDIDRYFSSSIFEKIRELNTVINYDRKKPIRFFYIIKDDIFTSKDRTKFFDFIIPVVPIVDASNSYGQLRSQLQEGAEGSSLDNRFLRGLSIYIDDMRVLKNIINEFLVYRKELVKQELNPNKLLAIITYKNLFPKDFNDLQAGTGYLYHLIKSRDNFAMTVIKSDLEILEKLNKQIEEIRQEHLETIEELGALYLRPTPYLGAVGGENIGNYDSQLSLFKEISKSPTNVIVGDYRSHQEDITQELNNLQKNVNYLKRKDLLIQKQQMRINSLETEKSKIELNIQTIKDSHLISNLIDPENIDYFINLPLKENDNKYKEVTDDLHFKIIPFLIRNEMIDGNYKDYLTYFYDNELKIQDQIFIRSIFDEKPLSINHKLTNPKAILEMLEGVSDNNPAFLNVSLFLYVFDKKKNGDAAKFIELEKRYKNFELIKDYLEEGKQIPLLIKTLNNLWDSFYSDVEVATKWNQRDRNRFLQMELIHEDHTVLQEVNSKNNISVDIESNKEIFAGIHEDSWLIFIENLTAIAVKLQDINLLVNAEPFLADIYINNLYKISALNVRFWLRKVYGLQEDIEGGILLSTIFSRPKEALSIYVSDHLGELIRDIVNNNPNVKFSDKQSTISKILTSSTAFLETKSLYIDRLLSKVEDITNISDIEVLKLLLVNDLIKLSTNNLLALFVAFEKTFTGELFVYLTKHEKDWVEDKDKHINSTLYPEELVTEFFNSAINDSSLNKLVTETLLAATGRKILNQTAVVGNEKAKALISSGALVMNENNLAYIRTNHPELVVKFEKINLQSFEAMLDSGKNANPQEIVNLLESDLDGTKQKSLLSHVNVKTPYKESYRFPGIKKYIINHLLDTEDLVKMVADPLAQEAPLISSAKTALIKNIDYVVHIGLSLPYPIFHELMVTKSITNENLIDVFSNSLGMYTPEVIRESVLALHISPFDEIFDGKKPCFESTTRNQKILSALEKKDMAKYSSKTGRIYPRGKQH